MRASNTWLCPFCTDEEGMPKEFKSASDYEEHMKGHSNRPAATEPLVTPQEALVKEALKIDPPRQPIDLTYKYTGQCQCGAPVDTIELDVGDKVKEHYCIAWCPVCKKELQQRKVVKL